MFKLFSMESLRTLVMACFTGYQPEIEHGKFYQLVTAGTTKISDKDGKSIECFSIIFQGHVEDTQDDPDCCSNGRSQVSGIIKVPKASLILDSSLPLNTIVWGKAQKVQGRYYLCVWWNPGPKVITDRPKVNEQLLVPA